MSWKKLIFISATATAVLSPIIVSAAEYAISIPYWGFSPDLLPCHGMDCTGACDFVVLFQHIIMLALSLGIFALAPLLIIIGGLMVLLGGASSGTLATGKKILTGTVIGIIFIAIAFIIVETLVHVFGVSGTGPGQVGGFGSSIQCSYPSLTLNLTNPSATPPPPPPVVISTPPTPPPPPPVVISTPPTPTITCTSLCNQGNTSACAQVPCSTIPPIS